MLPICFIFNAGYGLTISMLLFVGAVEILWEELFTLDTSYCLNLIAIAVIAWGATSTYLNTLCDRLKSDLYFYRNFLSLVQQSSFYGYTSILPTKYTQAVMIGESQ